MTPRKILLGGGAADGGSHDERMNIGSISSFSFT